MTRPHQHHQGDVLSPTGLARAYMGPQPPFRADIQAGAAREQKGELPENPEPENRGTTAGGTEARGGEEKTQPPQPQIRTPVVPQG
ncbi:MAG: hypothetical protein GY696_18755 [Gammaproteobacteria bacterium]|nr:hypothetical protein [Gammaproteobacteria bacterium]